MNLQERQLIRGLVMIIALALIAVGLAKENYSAVGMGVVVILAVLLDLKQRRLAQGFLVIIAFVLIIAGLAMQKYGAAVVGVVVIVAVLIDRARQKQLRASDVGHKA